MFLSPKVERPHPLSLSSPSVFVLFLSSPLWGRAIQPFKFPSPTISSSFLPLGNQHQPKGDPRFPQPRTPRSLPHKEYPVQGAFPRFSFLRRPHSSKASFFLPLFFSIFTGFFYFFFHAVATPWDPRSEIHFPYFGFSSHLFSQLLLLALLLRPFPEVSQEDIAYPKTVPNLAFFSRCLSTVSALPLFFLLQPRLVFWFTLFFSFPRNFRTYDVVSLRDWASPFPHPPVFVQLRLTSQWLEAAVNLLGLVFLLSWL